MTETLDNNENLSENSYVLMPIKDWPEPPIPVSNELSIGRGLFNQYQIADDFVSDRHCRIEKRGHKYILRDLNSRNGTFVNGARVVESMLTNRDQICIGKSRFTWVQQNEFKKERSLLTSKNTEWCKQLNHLPAIAKTQFPIAISGPSGSGKEHLARAVHDFSPRRNGPFVCLNCGALNESLIESELFGHVKGSFTGASNSRKGAFEMARGGTLFLDEIGDLPLNLQPKLLRALENNEIRPLGSDKNLSIDVRIVTATHHCLDLKVADGQFRADLYYRLNVIPLRIPALKSRMEDFEDLIYLFAREFRVGFKQCAIESLKQHNWPGNIRELRNTIARASAFYGKTRLNARNIPSIIENLPVASPLTKRRTLPRETERNLIVECLLQNHGNQKRTAADLGIAKSTLHDRIRAYGINVKSIVGRY